MTVKSEAFAEEHSTGKVLQLFVCGIGVRFDSALPNKHQCKQTMLQSVADSAWVQCIRQFTLFGELARVHIETCVCVPFLSRVCLAKIQRP